MILIKIVAENGHGNITLAGRAGDTDMTALMTRLEKASFLKLDDPAISISRQIAVLSDDGSQVRLVDGSWITRDQAANVPGDMIMMKNITRFVSENIDSHWIRASNIVSVRELSDEEDDEYTMAIKAGNLPNTGLEINTTGIVNVEGSGN